MVIDGGARPLREPQRSASHPGLRAHSGGDAPATVALLDRAGVGSSSSAVLLEQARRASTPSTTPGSSPARQRYSEPRAPTSLQASSPWAASPAPGQRGARVGPARPSSPTACATAKTRTRSTTCSAGPRSQLPEGPEQRPDPDALRARSEGALPAGAEGLVRLLASPSSPSSAVTAGQTGTPRSGGELRASCPRRCDIVAGASSTTSRGRDEFDPTPLSPTAAPCRSASQPLDHGRAHSTPTASVSNGGDGSEGEADERREIPDEPEDDPNVGHRPALDSTLCAASSACDVIRLWQA